MKADSFAKLGIECKTTADYAAHSGGASKAPLVLVVPVNFKPVEAIRATDMCLAIQLLEGVAPFASLALVPAVGTPTYLALTAADLRPMAAALFAAADQLDGGVGKQ